VSISTILSGLDTGTVNSCVNKLGVALSIISHHSRDSGISVLIFSLSYIF